MSKLCLEFEQKSHSALRIILGGELPKAEKVLKLADTTHQRKYHEAASANYTKTFLSCHAFAGRSVIGQLPCCSTWSCAQR